MTWDGHMTSDSREDALPFSMLLRRHRVAAGLSQEELAERARMSARGISDLERGVRRTPHRGTVMQLTEALELGEPERTVFEAAARRVGLPHSAGGIAAAGGGASTESQPSAGVADLPDRGHPRLRPLYGRVRG
jgi:transcriptional regulator with XRE-family HTH domain